MTDTLICPTWLSWSIDNPIRRMLQDPGKILEKHVTEGMTALDVGCGPGYFTEKMAQLVGKTGKVIALDMQQGMLDKVRKKINGKDIEERIRLHKSDEDRLRVTEKVDFALVFYMAHEVPDRKRLFDELSTIITPGGRMLVVEPKVHVTKKDFEETIRIAEKAGFAATEDAKIFFSRGKVLQRTTSS